ncbi:MAG TPA: HTTM domain-containing protein [Polyangiaceae bacterium]|nr:HTTM domain-containing protein [Polyangiaceae bacterium]
MSLVERWIRFWDRHEPADTLAVLRVLVGSVVLADLAQVAYLGLVEALWAPIEEGGMGPSRYALPVSVTYAWLSASAQHAWLIYGVACVAATALVLGARTRTSALLLVFAYAELSRLSPDADRGIDVLLRNAVLVLGFSGAGKTLSYDAWRTHGHLHPFVRVPSWPRVFIVLQLTVLYFGAGILKQSPAWTSLGGYSALFMVLQQPHYASFASLSLPPRLLVELSPLFAAATFVTVFWERSALALPLLFFFRQGRSRAGRLRAIVNRARLLEIWVALGVVFHLSLALSLELGIFPWGCLALYPALARPDTVRNVVVRGAAAARHIGRGAMRAHAGNPR